MAKLEDKEYRKLVSEAFARVVKAFDAVDPDEAEADLASGSVTILTPRNRSKIIVSPQPPVQQIWLAVAKLGVAVHFDWNATTRQWVDDKQQGLELFSHLENMLEKTAQIKITL